MRTARVLTPWVNGVPANGGLSSNHARLVDTYTPATCADVTGQPMGNLVPSPNLFTVEITCTDAVLAAIQGDSNYLVLWAQ